MLTNPPDAIRGQSRSPNIVPFNIIGRVSSSAIVTLSLTRLCYTSKNISTLKSGSEVTQGLYLNLAPFDRFCMISY